jgi:hypothetical protein
MKNFSVILSSHTKIGMEVNMRLHLIRSSSGVTIPLLIPLICIFFISFSYAEESPSFSIGAFGGFASSMTGEAVKGFEKTEWETGAAYGGSIIYRRENGLAFELLVEQFEMKLVEEGEEIGTLKVAPILFLVRYQGMPKHQKGITFHAEIGGGLAPSGMKKGDFIKELEDSDGTTIDISNDDAFIFEFGVGLDYFLNRNLSFTLDGRFLTGNIESKWDYGGGVSEKYTYYASNFQGLVGIRLWF